MAILKREEFFERLSKRIGDDTSDEGLKDMEDFTDTYNALSTKAEGDAAEWERKYNENDAMWKKRYKARFFSSGGGTYTGDDDVDDESAEDKELKRATSVHIDDLFK